MAQKGPGPSPVPTRRRPPPTAVGRRGRPAANPWRRGRWQRRGLPLWASTCKQPMRSARCPTVTRRPRRGTAPTLGPRTLLPPLGLAAHPGLSQQRPPFSSCGTGKRSQPGPGRRTSVRSEGVGVAHPRRPQRETLSGAGAASLFLRAPFTFPANFVSASCQMASRSCGDIWFNGRPAPDRVARSRH